MIVVANLLGEIKNVKWRDNFQFTYQYFKGSFIFSFPMLILLRPDSKHSYLSH